VVKCSNVGRKDIFGPRRLRFGATVLGGKLKMIMFKEAIHQNDKFTHAGGQCDQRFLAGGKQALIKSFEDTALPPPQSARFSWEGSSGKKGRNCETNPICFKTSSPSKTNNEKIFSFDQKQIL
jgi:hypothetical protein